MKLAGARRLFEVGIFVGIGRGAAAEKAQVGVGDDLVPCAGGDENCVSGPHILGGLVDFHFPGSLENEIELFGQAVVVALGGALGGQGRLGKTLFLDGRIGAIEDAADC